MENIKRAFEMAVHAYKTVPFYFNLAGKQRIDIEKINFTDIPIVDKSYMKNTGMSVLSSNFMGQYFKGELISNRTSGSTGKFTEVYWDRVDVKRSLLSLWLYRKAYYGIEPSDRMCYFYPFETDLPKVYEKENYKAFSKEYLFNGRLEEAYELILEYKPRWLLLQPSVAWMLCRLVKEKHKEIPSGLHYIELTGEYLEEAVRGEIQKTFHCQIANQYGSQEVNSIAYECPEGNLHIMNNNVYLEVLEKEEGELCLTTLQNRVMPLIRFNIGDRGRVLKDKKCSCGNCNDILQLYAGRSNDWVLLDDGRKMHAYALIQIIHRINHDIDGLILQYQIVQNTFTKFTFSLVIEEKEAYEFVRKNIIQQVKKRLKMDVQILVEFYENLLPEKVSGKLKCFYSEC